MRRMGRFICFLCVCLACLFVSAVVQLLCSRVAARTRGQLLARLTQAWARTLLKLLGLRVEVAHALPIGPYLLVANHQSYLDILILAAHFPAQFVAKHEISRWPLLGWLAALSGTLFLDRESTHSSVRCVYQMSRALRAGLSVQVFPEGTTSDGTRVLPFKPLLLAAAIRTKTPVQPLTIQFTSVNGEPLNEQTRDWLCWYGEMDFARHFWRLLAVREVHAQLFVHAPLNVTRQDTAHRLTAMAQQQIADAFSPSAVHERTLTWPVITKTNAPIAPKTWKSPTA